MAQRHWVGGTDNWNGVANAKWALTAGGAGGQAVPTSSDDVFFDSSSGAAVVTISASSTCLSLDCTGFTGTLTGSSALAVAGNLTLVSGMTFSYSGAITFGGAGTDTITSGGKSFSGLITSNANITLGDAFVSTGGVVFGNPITFNDGGFNFKCAYLDLGANAVTLTAGATTWEITSNNAGTSIDFGNSGAKTLSLTAGHTLKFSDTSNTNNRYKLQVGNGYAAYTFRNIWFARGASTGNNFFDGNLTMADLKDTGTAAHPLYFTASLFGGSYTFTTFTVSGTSGNLITIDSSTGSAADTRTHSLICSSGTISSDYLSIQHSVASGGASFYAGVNSTNNQGVASAGSGWTFTAPPPPTLLPNVSDSLTITESVSRILLSDINKFDSLTITESVSRILLSDINKFDSLTVTENTTAAMALAETVNISDSLTITESVSRILISDINIFDSLTTTESITAAMVLSETANIVDSLTITESINIEQVLNVINPTTAWGVSLF